MKVGKGDLPGSLLAPLSKTLSVLPKNGAQLHPPSRQRGNMGEWGGGGGGSGGRSREVVGSLNDGLQHDTAMQEIKLNYTIKKTPPLPGLSKPLFKPSS
jgi:hypothetical protein